MSITCDVNYWFLVLVPRVNVIFINKNENGCNRNHKICAHYLYIIINASKQTENCNDNSFAWSFKHISGCLKMVNGPCVWDTEKI